MDKDSGIATEETKKPIVSASSNGYLNQTELLVVLEDFKERIETLEDFKERIETLEANAATDPPAKTGTGTGG